MAIKLNNGTVGTEDVVNSVTGNTGANNGATNRTNTNVNDGIGFMTGGLQLMSASLGSEYTEKFATTIKEMYSKMGVNKPKVFVFDKEIIHNLGYSYIVVAQNDGNKVYYYTICLTATGNKPFTASQMYQDFLDSMKTNQKLLSYTIDQTFDSLVFDMVHTRLAESYGNNISAISVDGVIVNETNDIETIARRVAALGFNATKVEIVLSKGKDLNIATSLQQASGSMFTINVTPTTVGAIPDEVEKPHKATFNITVDMTTRQVVNSVHMSSAGNQRLANITGYIDAIPEEITVPTVYGQPPVTQLRLHPHVVITNVKTMLPTTGYLMMAIATSLVMEEPDVLYPIIAKDPNVGALNIITNLKNNPNGVGEIIDLSSKKVAPEEAYAVIRDMFSLKPIFSVDVDAFGSDSFVTSILSVASELNGSPSCNGALQKIINTCVNLTNGAFPKDYPLGEVFAFENIKIPSGFYTAKDGEKDIKDVNLAFIAKTTQDAILLNTYVMSEFPRSKSGIDPFFSRLELTAKILPESVVDTRTSRVRFTGKFMATLLNAVRAAGFDPKYKPLMTMGSEINYGQIQNFLANSVVDTTGGFGRVGMGGQAYNYQTPNYGGGFGYNRNF